MGITIAIESPLQDEVRALIAALNAYLRPLSPPEFQFQMTAEQMADPATTVFLARNGDRQVVGMGALKVHTEALGEVKRMFTLPEVRGKRVGRALLEAISDKAQGLGLSKLVLETGNTTGFEPAWRLYERAGFTRCGAVLDYPDSGWSAFYERAI